MWDLEADACIIKFEKKISIRPRRKAKHEPSGLTLERDFAVDFSKKKNGESLSHRSLDGIENIRVSLQSCGVSRGLEIRKVALRI